MAKKAAVGEVNLADLNEWRDLGEQFTDRYDARQDSDKNSVEHLAYRIEQLQGQAANLTPEKELQSWQALGRVYLKTKYSWDGCDTRREKTARVCRLLGQPYRITQIEYSEPIMFKLPGKGVEVDPEEVIESNGELGSFLVSGKKKAKGKFRVALIDDRDNIVAYGDFEDYPAF